MIDLFVGANRQGYGIEAALSTERIPYRRIKSPEDAAGRLLVIAAYRVPDSIARLAASMPTIVIGRLPVQLRGLFPDHGEALRTEAFSVPLVDLPLPPAITAIAARFGAGSLDLPQARVAGNSGSPLVASNGFVTWCRLDIGFTLASLLGESYYPAPDQALTPRLIPAIYYRLPERIRSILQRRVYRDLRNHLSQAVAPSSYPVDASGWLLVELLKSLIRGQAGGLVRLLRWPAPYSYAAALTHDIEPSPFAYREGLQALLQTNSEAAHAPSYGLVTRCATEWASAESVATLRESAVYCHGWEHRGETVAGTRRQIRDTLRGAKSKLEDLLHKRIPGFRSPRLDRSPDLFEALDEVGFEYSSSAPDVDRESVARFGGGVRFNLPFRPPLQNPDGTIRASRCLEIPVSAPDCIQPLFMGESEETLQAAVQTKIDYLAAIGGVYSGIVHGGVFDHADVERRMRHLRFVAARMQDSDAWVTTMDEIAQWWARREQVTLIPNRGSWTAYNSGTQAVEGLCFIEEDEHGAILQQTILSTLEAQASLRIPQSNHFNTGAHSYATTI